MILLYVCKGKREKSGYLKYCMILLYVCNGKREKSGYLCILYDSVVCLQGEERKKRLSMYII